MVILHQNVQSWAYLLRCNLADLFSNFWPKVRLAGSPFSQGSMDLQISYSLPNGEAVGLLFLDEVGWFQTCRSSSKNKSVSEPSSRGGPLRMSKAIGMLLSEKSA